MDNNVKMIVGLLVLSILIGSIVFMATMHRETGKANVKVISSRWVPTPSGYALQVSATTSRSVSIVYVRLERHAVKYIARINPPVSNITLYVSAKKQYKDVILDFSDGETVKIHPEKHKWAGNTKIDFYFSGDTLFLVGNLPEPIDIVAFPREISKRVLVVVSDKSVLHPEGFTNVIGLLANVTVVPVTKITNETLMNYTHIAFVDVTPSPRLFKELIKTGHKIAYIGETTPFGTYRFDIFSSGVQTYLDERGGIDYFGADCTVPVRERASQYASAFIKELYKLTGASESNLAIMDSPYCRKQLPRVYVIGDKGYAMMASDNNTLVAYGPRLPAIVLFSLGITDNPKVALKEATGGVIGPLFGVNPIGTSRDYRFIRIITFSNNRIASAYDVVRYPFNVTVENDTYYVTIPPFGFKPGFHKITVYEYDLMFHLVGVRVNGSIYIPGTVKLPFNPENVYIIEIDGRPTSMIAYNSVWSPSVKSNIDYTGICELYTLTVKGETNVPLQILLDGYPVYKTGIGKFTWKSQKCSPGEHEVLLLLPNKAVVKKESFKVTHIYSSPFFIISFLILASGIAGFYASTKMKSTVEIESFKGVFYELEETKRTYIKRREVVDLVKKLEGRLNRAPTFQEFLDEANRITHSFEGVIQASKHLGDLIGKGVLTYTWRYVPEIGDHIGVVSTDKEVAKHFYFTTLNRIALMMGGILRRTDDLRKLIDSDAILRTDIEKMRYLLVSFAPTEKDIRTAINTALRSFIRMRSNNLPIELTGFAIITERKYVKAINDMLDAIFKGDTSTAERILVDASIMNDIAPIPAEQWYENFLIVAVPIDRVAPLIAFTALKATRLGNKYYRFTNW